MPTKLDICQLGHPILRSETKEVEFFSNQTLQGFIDDMIFTCKEVDGVGISGPQVLVPLRLFIIASRPNLRYPNAPQMDPLAIVNPVILSASDEMEKGWEGCLSVPGIYGLVPRHKSITVRFMNRNGEQEERTFDDFVARVFQHEFDHIEGVVFLDRANSRDLVMKEEYLKIVERDSKK